MVFQCWFAVPFAGSHIPLTQPALLLVGSKLELFWKQQEAPDTLHLLHPSVFTPLFHLNPRSSGDLLLLHSYSKLLSAPRCYYCGNTKCIGIVTYSILPVLMFRNPLSIIKSNQILATTVGLDGMLKKEKVSWMELPLFSGLPVGGATFWFLGCTCRRHFIKLFC